MAVRLRPRGNLAARAALAGIAVSGVVAAYAGVALAGTKTGLALSMLCTLGPALLYAALTSPILFPFGLYAGLTPFDNMLDIPSFGTVTRMLGAAAAIAMIFYLLRTKRFADPPRALVWWILLYLWMAASLFWAIEPDRSIQILSTAVQLFALYLVVTMFVVRLSDLRRLIVLVILGGAASSLYGIYLYMHGVNLQQRLSIASGANDSSVVDPNQFAAALVVPIALAFLAVTTSKNLAFRILAGTMGAVMLLALALSGSRGAMVGLLATVLYVVWRSPNRLRLLLAFGSIAAVVAAFSWSYLENRFQLAAVNGGAGRLDIWRVGLLAFQQNWLLGAGYADFQFAYDRAYIHVFQPFATQWDKASHDLLLGTGVELGVIGLVLTLLAWWGQYKMLDPIGRGDARYPLRVTLQGCVLGLFVVALFSDIMIQKFIWLLFMLVVLTRNAVPDPEPRRA
jgi:hypothetical protein